MSDNNTLNDDNSSLNDNIDNLSYDINMENNTEQDFNFKDIFDDKSTINTYNVDNIELTDINHIIDSHNNNNTNKIKFLDVKYYVDDFFNSSVVYKYSCALDILGSYLKGQKILYNESKNLYFYYLNCLMIPCIFLSSLSTVLSQTSLNDTFNQYHNLILCVINALITCLLTCLSYLKLDAGSESFKICANQYEKLEKEIIFTSGETLLFSHPCLEDTNFHKNKQIFEKLNNMNPHSNEFERQSNSFTFLKQYYKKYNYEELKLIDILKTKIKDIKKKILEIDEANQFTIPKKIQTEFLNIYSINVFTLIKKIEDYKTKLIMKLKNIKNEIIYYDNKKNSLMEEGKQLNEDDKNKVSELFKCKYSIIEKILYLKTSFLIIDNIFQQEIKNNFLRKQYFFRFMLINTFGDIFPDCFICTLYPKDYMDPKEINPMIYKILFEPFIENDINNYKQNHHLF